MAYICNELQNVVMNNQTVQVCSSWVLYQQSWTEQLNSLSVVQVSGLLTTTALIWYVASAIRTHLNLLAYEGDIK